MFTGQNRPLLRWKYHPTPSASVPGSEFTASGGVYYPKLFENCGIKEITDWLNCDMEDAGFQLLNDKEIIAEVRHSPKEDDDDEGENDSQVKINNNDVFECFSNGLTCLVQQEQRDSSELMLLRKLDKG
ncbi:hypothetical protein AVEN_111771-1 [Araneus ventricosus]|uniref:Uncharacterized protein n=1 Tax=Araneus ventricosus TaxID=182803 RepID=A0A4Y2QA33_ARAVE|nr:hypothetical protein AVEN_44525-1 [Araneus ventricosus]GBN59943.1 hypothetical protein AVEN_111771-1 [Araneus ventricosus]